ncbi:hypothetical protein [Mycoplasmopsis columbinasalis]|uniref:Lipoprotein n=1 Tax=Mycoplasmopsis columbinasalis TaxID=114880 RepID=A0A449BA99_9BACT|nr:hypothetical protein [Mycoplasmopsis columbinasalis]VEU78079.1 Uncharacterised protein [Mycoplasmopsis columbinasalis]
MFKKIKRFFLSSFLLSTPFLTVACAQLAPSEQTQILKAIENESLDYSDFTKAQTIQFLNSILIRNQINKKVSNIPQNTLYFSDETQITSKKLTFNLFSKEAQFKNNKYEMQRESTESTELNILYELLPQTYIKNDEYHRSLWRNNVELGKYSSLIYDLPNLQTLAILAKKSNNLGNNYKTPFNEIRINGFVNSKFQQELFANELLFLLNQYKIEKDNKKIAYVEIFNLVTKENFLEFQINLLDEERKSLLNEMQLNHKFYLDDFLNFEQIYGRDKLALYDKISGKFLILTML